MDTTANRIRTLRTAKGWSLQQLASRVGASKPQIDKLEKGTRRLTPEWQDRIAAALGVERAALLGGDVPPGRPERAPDTEPRGARPSPSVMDTPRSEVDTTVSEPYPIVSRNPSPVSDSRPAGLDTLPLRGFGRIGARGQPVGVLVSPAEAPERVWLPAPLAGVAGAYAVRMPDSSMAPRYQAGQLLFVHPYRTPGAGDPVVVLLGDGRFMVGLLAIPGGESLVIERLSPQGRFAIPGGLVRGVERIVVVEEP